MIWIKRIGIALLVGLALTLLPLFLPSVDLLYFPHWPMLLFERAFKSLIPLNAGKRLITLFLANVGMWTVMIFLLEATWHGLKRRHATPPS